MKDSSTRRVLPPASEKKRQPPPEARARPRRSLPRESRPQNIGQTLRGERRESLRRECQMPPRSAAPAYRAGVLKLLRPAPAAQSLRRDEMESQKISVFTAFAGSHCRQNMRPEIVARGGVSERSMALYGAAAMFCHAFRARFRAPARAFFRCARSLRKDCYASGASAAAPLCIPVPPRI